MMITYNTWLLSNFIIPRDSDSAINIIASFPLC